MGRPFRNWRCKLPPPEAGGWMRPDLRQGCIRKDGHPGPHRTRVFEWPPGAKSLDEVVPRKGQQEEE
jgi:hypothetical protein